MVANDELRLIPVRCQRHLHGTPWPRIFHGIIDKIQKEFPQPQFVAEDDSGIVGFAAVISRADGGAELDALFVEPHLWKRGIGRRLVDHVADVARASGTSFLHVVGNPPAEGFYLSCGFRVTGTVDTRFGVGLDMRRPL